MTAYIVLSQKNILNYTTNLKLKKPELSNYKLVIANREGSNEKYIEYRPLNFLERLVHFFGIGSSNFQNVIEFACANNLFYRVDGNHRIIKKIDAYNNTHFRKIDIMKPIHAIYGHPMVGFKQALNCKYLGKSKLALCLIKQVKVINECDTLDEKKGTVAEVLRQCYVNQGYYESDCAKAGLSVSKDERATSQRRKMRLDEVSNIYSNLGIIKDISLR